MTDKKKSDTSVCSPESEDLNLGFRKPHEVSKAVRNGGRSSLTKKHNWDIIDVSVFSKEPTIYDPLNQTFPKDQQSTTSLRTNSSNGNAWVFQKQTNTQVNSSNKNSQMSKTTEMPQKLDPKTYQNLICSVEDFLVKHSRSLENGEVSRIPVAQCFLKLKEYLKLKDLRIYSLKMSKGYLVTKRGTLSESSWRGFKSWGIMLNGWFLTASFSESPKTESGSSLSEVLETNPDSKYYLSEKTLKNLSKRVRKGWNSNMMETIKVNESTRFTELLQQYPSAKQEEIIFRLLRNRIRRLTEVECERLQSFPDNWTKGFSMTQRYSMMGNAVTVNVVEALGKQILKNLEKERK